MSRLVTIVCRAAPLALLVSVAASVAPAATLTFDSPLHLRPDGTSPVLATLPAGSTIAPLAREDFAAAGVENLPPGWVPVRASGPFQGFVRNTSIGKEFRVRTGATIHASPDADATVLHTVAEGETATAGELVGDWSAVSFNAGLVVYVNAVPPGSRRRDADTAATPTPPPAPMPAEAANPNDAALRDRLLGREPKADPTPVVTNATPRVFVGFLTRTRRILGTGPKLDYQLVDAENRRIALLDVSALLLTSPLDAFEGKWVSVYGPGMTRADIKDPIIRVETLRLAR